MPFGLQGAPPTFQRMMHQLMRSLKNAAVADIDNAVVHLPALRAILEVLMEAGLTVKPRKCHFAMKECSYLSHIV